MQNLQCLLLQIGPHSINTHNAFKFCKLHANFKLEKMENVTIMEKFDIFSDTESKVFVITFLYKGFNSRLV